MVKHQQAPLDRTFAALADPTRRALLTRIADEPGVSVTALARPFPVSLPAVMKHLDVLSEAGLISRRKSGRTVACQLTAAPMQDAVRWLSRYQQFWSRQLDQLAAFLEEETCPPPSSRASPSDAGSAPRPPGLRGLDAAGPDHPVVRAPRRDRHRRRVRAAGRGPVRGFRHRCGRRDPSVGGIVREVEPDRRLVYTWAWHTTPERESLVTVEFKPDGDGTLLTLTHEQFFDEEARDRHRFGWTGTLDKLEAHLT